MFTSSATIECALQNDRRLIAAVGPIVAHAAQHAGLSERDQEEIAAAAADACREAFAHAIHPRRKSALRLVVDDFSDRIVVTVEYPGEPIPPSASNGFKTPAKSTPQRTQAFDRVSHETSDGWSRITLVKYAKAAVDSKLRDSA